MIYKVTDTHLTIQVVKKIFIKVQQCMSLTDDIVIDLTKVEYLDTAGVALILSWWQYAVTNDIVCHFKANDIVASAVRSYQIELP